MSRKYQKDDGLGSPSSPASPTRGTAAAKPKNLGLYRTLIAIAAAVATILIVVWVGRSSGRYNDNVVGAHKTVVIVVDGLHPEIVEFAASSNKAPFMKELVRYGAVYGGMSVPETVQDELAAKQAILTGLTPSQTNVFSSNDFGRIKSNTSSFLKLARQKSLSVVTIAPNRMYSGSTYDESSRCSSLGFLDAECVGMSCPGNDTLSYCNAQWKFKTAEDGDDETRNEDYIFTKVESAAAAKMDIIYLQLSNFMNAGTDLSTNSLAAISEMYVTDAFIGRIASLLAARSGSKTEKWLLVVTSDGQNAYKKSTYFMAQFDDGAPAPVKQPSAAPSLLDIFPTIAYWAGLSPADAGRYNGTIIGVCDKNGRTLAQGC